MAGQFTRREALKGVAGGAAAAALGAALATPALAKGSKRPNVLFIPIDDLNDWTGWLGGYPGVETPNLDRLAKLVTGFTRAYTPAPACQAARAAILFGIEPFRSGVYTNKTANWPDTNLKDRPSIVRWFKEAGYETIGTGKIFHGGWRRADDGPEENDPKAWSRFEYLPKLLEGGKEGPNNWGPSGEKTSETEDVGRAKWLVKTVLSKRSDKPFFASFGVRKPHMPWVVPQKWFDAYPIDEVRYPLGALDTGNASVASNRDDRDLPEGGRAMARQFADDHRKIIAGKGWKSAIQAYLAAVSLADHAVGLVLDGLSEGPNAADTIICVWSDHGWQLGEKLAWRKFTLWERATHVPLLIGGPGLKSGLSSALISTIDIYPTLAELGVGEAPTGLDGVSFAGRLRDGGAEPRDHVLSTWALDVDGGASGDEDKHFAVRTKTHRLIQYGNGDRELYDNSQDPWEWNNLYDAPSKASIALADRLAANLPRSPVPQASAGGKVVAED
ncbi:sulfatase [Methylopila sp. M107]|uniref:sulfatase n=1 Tax=Methylopila sp. M107 TaxID=1101190 RepID=UPI00036F32F8|nr:sulfatase [Methylopila sp. M107]